MTDQVIGGSGHAVVLLHAFPVNHHLWDGVAPARRRRVPGRGAGLRRLWRLPIPTAPPSVDAMADDLLARLEGMGITQFCLAGLSMGGYAAMAILRQAPERITALGLLDAKDGGGHRGSP